MIPKPTEMIPTYVSISVIYSHIKFYKDCLWFEEVVAIKPIILIYQFELFPFAELARVDLMNENVMH